MRDMILLHPPKLSERGFWFLVAWAILLIGFAGGLWTHQYIHGDDYVQGRAIGYLQGKTEASHTWDAVQADRDAQVKRAGICQYAIAVCHFKGWSPK